MATAATVDGKLCPVCGEHKSLDEFHRLKSAKDGRFSRCKLCQNAKQRAWRKANPDKRRAAHKRYRMKHPEKTAAKQRRNYLRHADNWREYGRRYAKEHPEENCAQSLRWQQAHPEYHREQSRKYRERHPERVRAIQAKISARPAVKAAKAQRYREHAGAVKAAARQWAKENPEKVLRSSRVSGRKRRAHKLAVAEVWTVEMESLVRAQFNNQCAICQRTTEDVGRTLHVDHWRPLSRGFPLTLKNAVLMCPGCNCSKGAKLPEEVYSLAFVEQIEAKLGV